MGSILVRQGIWLRTLLSALGPGFLAAMADNDAGGILSYSVTGVKFGVGLFLPLIFSMVLLTYPVQEMSMRLGIVTQTGLTRLVRHHFGAAWLWYHVFALLGSNLLTMVTEFIGMSAGLVVVGIPLAPAVLVSLLMVVAITLFTGYSTKERIALVLASLNGLFLVVAFLTHPDWSSIAKAICFLSGPSNTGGLPFYVFALLGNTLAPWMITFQCSAYIDKGVPSSHLGIGRLDTLTGSVVQAVVAASVLIVGATLAGHLPDVEHLGPSALLYGFGTFLGPVAATLFAMALFNAGLLASMTVSLSSSWSIAEIFGWARSLNDRIPEAPRFSSVYIGSQIIATVLLLTTNIPLNMISTLSQIVSGILLIPVVIFLVLLTNRESVLGSHKNGRVRRPIAFILAATLVVSVVALIVLCLLPDES